MPGKEPFDLPGRAEKAEPVSPQEEAPDHQPIPGLEWLLKKSSPVSDQAAAPCDQTQTDLSRLNTCRLILDSVGREALQSIAEDALDLLETSLAIYEENGDYAFGMFSSGWCRLLDAASRRLCSTDDDRQALTCGKWLCHENCWNDSAKAAIQSGKRTDIRCVGGIHLFAEPIQALGRTIGAINIGYGDPPTSPEAIRVLAGSFQVPEEELRKAAASYASRPQFIIDLAKKKLALSAKLIGQIVERAQAEEALRQKEELLAAAGRIAKVGGWELEPETGHVRWTKQTYAIHEVTEEYQPSLEDALEFFHHEDRDHLAACIEKAVSHGEPYDLELRFHTAKGVPLWTRTICEPKVENGRVTLLKGIFQDITEQKQAEEEIRENESHLQSILQAAPDPLVVYDLKGRPQYMNSAFSRVFGWSFEELEGSCIPFVPGDQQEITRQKIREIYDHGQPVQFETARLTKAGRRLEVVTSAAVIRDGQGKLSGLVVNIADVTEFKRLEAQFRQSQKMESVGRLAGGVAHDFNNMLSIILGNGELLERSFEQNQQGLEKVRQIMEAAGRARDLTRQLLAFGRQQDLEMRVVDINAVVHDLEKLLLRTLGEDIEIRVSTSPLPLTVRADKTQLEQVLINLAINARDAMPDGGLLHVVTQGIELEAACQGDDPGLEAGRFVLIAVSDTGTGMDESLRRNIFEPFFSTKDKGQGSGLGLATVYGIVRQHGGHIRVDSQPAQGATFEVFLPWVDEEPEAEAEAEDEEARGLADKAATLLVVEDEPMVRELAREILVGRGYRILQAGGCEEAVEVAQAHTAPIHLLLTDMIMPDGNGPEVYRRVAEIHPEAKVLFMSGYAEEVIGREIRSSKDVPFLAKPFSIQGLTGKVEQVLGDRCMNSAQSSGDEPQPQRPASD